MWKEHKFDDNDVWNCFNNSFLANKKTNILKENEK